MNNQRHKHAIDYVADVNSGVSAVALLPQLITVLGHKSTVGLSPLTFFLIALNSSVWFAYGIHRHAPPLIISSSLNALVSIVILGAMYIWA
jgi:uncharacterized protein with PQ loop repeat